jgi:hypothetical protein
LLTTKKLLPLKTCFDDENITTGAGVDVADKVGELDEGFFDGATEK